MEPVATATCIKTIENSHGRVIQLYKVEPALAGIEEDYDYVIVSGINNSYAHETFIFGSNEKGDVICWRELPGSFSGGIDVEEALNRAGYEILEK